MFGPDHLAVLVLLAVAIAVLVARAPWWRRAGGDRAIRGVLASALALNRLALWLDAARRGSVGLPCHLCDLAVFLMIWTLVTGNRYAAEVAYCWGLAGSTQAIITPDLSAGFPSWRWLTFFSGHCGVVASGIYLVVKGRLSLTSWSVWRVWLISNGYVVVAGLLNWRLGTNFGYLAGKPQHPSLLDYLGPWPWYIGSMDALGLALFVACVAFGRWVDHVAETPS